MELRNLIYLLKNSEKFAGFAAALSPQTPYKISGLGPGAKAFWTSPLLAGVPETLLIATASKEEEDIFVAFFDYLGFKDFDIFPTLEISPYEPVITDINLLDKQYQVIEKLLKKQAKCIITKSRGLNQKLPSIRDLTENIVTIRATQEISPLSLTEELIRLGYKPSTTLEKKGQFSRKGGTITIFPVGYPNPVKVGWFDDEIEFIKEFDIETAKTKEDITYLTLYPVSKVVMPAILPVNLAEQVMQAMMTQIVNVYSRGLTKNAEDLRRRVETGLNNLKNFDYDENTFSFFNYLYKEGASLLDYLPAHSIVVWSEFTSQNSVLKKFEENLENSLAEKYEKGLLLETTGQLYIPLNDILKKARNFSQLRCSSLNDMPNVNIQFSGTMLPVFTNKFEELILTLKKWSQQEKKKVLIISVQPQRALTLLRERDLNVIYGEEPDFSNHDQGNIWVLRGEISKGFAYPDLNLIVITDSELFGWAQRPLKKKSKEKKDAGIRINKVQDIKIDDYVVHEIHGIGQYKGLRIVELEGRKREYFELIYSKNDKLLVPIEQINLLSLYRGSTDVPPRLSRMGGAEWENLKGKIKDSVRDIAGELIELYSRRLQNRGYGFPPDTEWQGQMEDAFPYDETPDQLQAIQETKADMETPRPMDRLICGDVGFGKTEVAIRAAFKGVMSGKQVAILAPTTVLSQQLYDVFQQRFAPYPVKVGILNRFRSARESKQIYDDLKKGNLDIVVSTHRILMKTPEFFDLGLVIIDEEHKFGVVHKERLKQFKTSVDVLAMSATPIPRTLYMALSGARDMSLIETPPQNRFPIQTKLHVFSKELIRNAVLHELERGGQVYFVHNRVESLGRLHRELKELLPDISIGIGHGQLPEHELENVMLGFNNKEYDVLLCTTIIESGLDIPSANTIIIDQVQLLGLAQLYQLRGRVGRADVQAYAYFLYPENLKLTDEARQRLQVIQDMSELGSGYQIALRDMEIRGVGDLLGAEQHGNVLSVGYDTYCQILEETVNELKPEGERTSNYSPTVIIDINLPCYIPDTWIDDYRLKMQAYRRLAVVQDLDLFSELQKELKDHYGEVPLVTENLFKIVKIRILASKLGIRAIKSANKTLSVKFKIHEKTWRDLVNKYSDLMRWQWSLDELTTRTSASSEGDVNLLEKFLLILVNAFKKEEEKAEVA
jgi:transcription-repair coupling factor (superfamily II helicase)